MFEKLSSYNLITNLIPGAVLAVALEAAGLPLVPPDKVGAFVVLAYILGAISSRLGSLLLDPILERAKWLPAKDYPAFVKASQGDTKLDTLVETANSYRTFAMAGILFFVVYGFYRVGKSVRFSSEEFVLLSVAAVTALFIFSYRKQFRYVASRVAAYRVQ